MLTAHNAKNLTNTDTEARADSAKDKSLLAEFADLVNISLSQFRISIALVAELFRVEAVWMLVAVPLSSVRRSVVRVFFCGFFRKVRGIATCAVVTNDRCVSNIKTLAWVASVRDDPRNAVRKEMSAPNRKFTVAIRFFARFPKPTFVFAANVNM